MSNDKIREEVRNCLEAAQIAEANGDTEWLEELEQDLMAALTQQPESEPVEYQFQDDGVWYPLEDERHHRNTEAAGYRIRALYDRPQPTPQVPEGWEIKRTKDNYISVLPPGGDVALEVLPRGILVDEILYALCEAILTGAHIRTEPAAAVEDVIAERQRQVTAENWTPDHDDSYSDNELTRAAICYADPYMDDAEMVPAIWPWEELWWKPKTRRRDLTRAAALIIAEIERLDRRPEPPAGGE